MAPFEKNRDSLKKALRELPSYDPPISSWDQIQAGLNKQARPGEEALRAAIGNLPAHTPPVSVWNRLTKMLDATQKEQHLRVVRRRQVLSWAAAGALLLSVAYWIMHEPAPKVSWQYAEEEVQDFQMEVDWNSDEQTFTRLEESLAALNDPALNKLQMEYEELSSAHQDVEAMLNSYGRDPQLIRQMADIERERTDIYRQIIELI